MKQKLYRKFLATLLIFSLTGCGTDKNQVQQDTEKIFEIQQTSPDALSLVSDETVETVENSNETAESEEEVIVPAMTEADENLSVEKELTEKQKTSYAMLYHLAITAEEIHTSHDNRLILEDIYTSLLNDINPDIDDITQKHIQNLRDIIKSYFNISVKRERLQYIHNQNKATAIRNAVPDPLAILSMTNSLDWKKLVISTVFTVVDSYNNYKSAEESIDQEFLLSGWELDDEENDTILRNRDLAFDYMVDIIQEYHLEGNLTLNEKAIEDFAKICALENLQQKIQRLKAEEETYKLFGDYWLELADCYYETEKYQDCLDCIETYNNLSIGIFRQDYAYAKILPKVIVAAQEIYSGDDYVEKISTFAKALIDNVNTEDWSSRYFVAQVYLDLYTKTNQSFYINEAYKIVLNNVAYLIDGQKALNDQYKNEVQEVTIEEPDYRFLSEDEKKEREKKYAEEKKLLKAYNKSLHDIRKTELPTLYEPLILNCELLFMLADKLSIDPSEQNAIEGILETATNGVFTSEPINNHYSFSTSTHQYHVAELTKNEIIIPVILLTDQAKITVSATENDQTVFFDDCVVNEVERSGENISEFMAHITSKKMKAYKWTADSKVTIHINYGDIFDEIVFHYKVKEYKDIWLIGDKVIFEEA